LLASTWGAVVGIYRALTDAFGRLLRLNGEGQDELEPTPKSLWWLNACAILLTIATTAAAFQEGLDQRMHRSVPDGVDMLAQTVAIDLSHRLYGTTGYVGRTEVLEALFNGGFTGRQNYLDKLGIQYPANVEMPDRINEVIQKALTLRDLPKDATFANRLLYAPEANDPGIVDYVSWSFDIFGFRVESFYYFYFLILSISIAFYVICFRADALPLVVLSGVMVAFLILMNSRLFETVLLRAVQNQRFLGTLCVVSYLHLVFAVLIYRKPTLSRVLVTALQAALFVFVMFTRSSAFWMVLSLAVIITLHVALRLGRQLAHLIAVGDELVGFCFLEHDRAVVHDGNGCRVGDPLHHAGLANARDSRNDHAHGLLLALSPAGALRCRIQRGARGSAGGRSRAL